MTSLRHRLTLPVLLVVVTMVSCYSWFIYERLASELERQFLLRGQLLLKSMVYALEMEHHEEDLPRVIHSFASEKGVKDIVLVAGSPLIIKAANPPSWLNTSLENLPKEMQGHLLDAIQGKKEVTHFIRQEEFSLHLARPLLLFSNDSQGPQPGALLVKLQAITMQSELAAMKYAMMGTLLTMASFSMVLIWLLLRRNVFIPLQTLISAMSRRAQGDFNAYAPLSTQDEIGQMAFAYNGMLDALASYETTLLEEKERAEQLLTTLQDSEEQFRISFENAPFGMCLVGLDQKIQKTNAAFCRLANRGEEALLGAHFFAVMSYEKALTTTEAPDLEIIAATPFRMEMGFSHSDSPCQWAEVGLSLVRDGRGYPRFYIVQIQDVTSRKLAEQEILHRLEVEKAVCLSSQELISRRHPIHTISLSALALAIGADRACIFKISPNDGVPKVLDHWHHPDLPPCPCHNKQDERYEWLLSHFTHKQFGGGIMINHVPSLPDSQAEKSFLVKHGILGWICLPIRYSKGELRGFIAFDRITKLQSWQEEDFSAIQVAADLLGGHWERLETEEEKLTIQERAMRTSHLASLGMLSAGVAHEINNPNNLIMFNAPLLGKFWDGVIPILEDKRQREGSFTLGGLPVEQVINHVPRLVGGIQSGAQRIQHIVAQLKRLVKPRQSGREEAVDLKKLVQDALSIIHPQLQKRSCILHLHMEDHLPMVRGSVQELEQVFLNIIINAMESLNQPNRNIWVQASKDHEQSQVILSIRDEGVGISPEALPKVMDPLYTTKGENGGTGLGLAISKNILDKFGGLLELASQPGLGTTVKIILQNFQYK